MDIGEERKTVIFEPIIEDAPAESPPVEAPQEEPISV